MQPIEPSPAWSSPRERAWNAALTASPGDLDLPALEVEGALPDALAGGRYLLNGPGWVSIGGRLVHPFDGHGYLRSLRFEGGGRASLRARFVRTRAYRDEAREGRVVHRGLATNPSDRWWENVRAPGQRNVANTTVVPWAGRLLCGWEGGRPFALDPETLETRGEEDFGGSLPSGAVLAHMRVDTESERLVTLTVGMGRHTTLVFRELDRAGRSVSTHQATIPSTIFAHDFVVTPRWYVLAGNPLTIDVRSFLAARLGAGTLLDAIRADSGARGALHLIPRGREGAARTIELDRPLFAVHFANAFDEGGELVADVCAFEHFTFGHEFGYVGPHAALDPTLPDKRGAPQQLGRIRVPVGARTATWQGLSSLGCDFPRVADRLEGRDAPAVYVATRAAQGLSDPFDTIARVDLRRDAHLHRSEGGATADALWQAPPDCFVGEPVFAPRPGGEPDEGWVLAMVYDGLAGRSELVVLASDRVAEGPIAKVLLPLLPYGFHGAWEPAA